MIISLIVAMSRNRGIGIKNDLPWKLPEDLKRFRALTWGHHLIVGRKTFESIGRPLPGRTMIVVTRQQGYHFDGCLVAHSVDEALVLAAKAGESEVFVAGGAEIYQQTLGQADKLYLTLVHAEVEADTYFPSFDETEWVEQEIFCHPGNEKNRYSVTFKVLSRKREK